MPRFTRRGRRGAAGLAGRGQQECCPGAEGIPELEEPGSDSGERRVPRCRQREADTAAAGRGMLRRSPAGPGPAAGGDKGTRGQGDLRTWGQGQRAPRPRGCPKPSRD